MFYVTPNKNTCFDLEQVLCFFYNVDEKTNQVDKKELKIFFKNGSGLKIKETETEKGVLERIFSDLYKYLNHYE